MWLPEFIRRRRRRANLDRWRHHVAPAARPGLTTDRTDPRLGHGVDEQPIPQHDTYLVLSDEERAQGFVRVLRSAYRHETCGTVTTMGRALAETYARNPHFYGATYCCHCRMHRPVGLDGEFTWIEPDGSEQGWKVGT